jgi:hypothetical protein
MADKNPLEIKPPETPRAYTLQDIRRVIESGQAKNVEQAKAILLAYGYLRPGEQILGVKREPMVPKEATDVKFEFAPGPTPSEAILKATYNVPGISQQISQEQLKKMITEHVSKVGSVQGREATADEMKEILKNYPQGVEKVVAYDFPFGTVYDIFPKGYTETLAASRESTPSKVVNIPSYATTASPEQLKKWEEQRKGIEILSKMWQTTKSTEPIVWAETSSGVQPMTRTAYLGALYAQSQEPTTTAEKVFKAVENVAISSMYSTAIAPLVLIAPLKKEEPKVETKEPMTGVETKIIGLEKPAVTLEQKVVAGVQLVTLAAGVAGVPTVASAGATALGAYGIVKSAPGAMKGDVESIVNLAASTAVTALGAYGLYTSLKPAKPAEATTVTLDKTKIFFEKEKVEVGDKGTVITGGKVRAYNPQTKKIETIGSWEGYGDVVKVAENPETEKSIFAIDMPVKVKIFKKYEGIFRTQADLEKAGLIGVSPADVTIEVGDTTYHIPKTFKPQFEVARISDLKTQLKSSFVPDLARATSTMITHYEAELSPPSESAGVSWKIGEVKAKEGYFVENILGRKVAVKDITAYRGISIETKGTSLSAMEGRVMTVGGKIVEIPSGGPGVTTTSGLQVGSFVSLKPEIPLYVKPTVSPTLTTTAGLGAGAVATTKETVPTVKEASVQKVVDSSNLQRVVGAETAFFSRVGTIEPKTESRVISLKPQIEEEKLQQYIEAKAYEIQKQKEVEKTITKTLEEQKLEIPTKEKQAPKTLTRLKFEELIGEQQQLMAGQVQSLERMSKQRQLQAVATRLLTEERQREKIVTFPPSILVPSSLGPVVSLQKGFGYEARRTIPLRRKSFKGYFEKIWPVLSEPKELGRLFRKNKWRKWL